VNEFKKGDRVVFVKDDHYADVEMPKGTLATYDDDDDEVPYGPAAPWVALDTGERVRAWRDYIDRAEPEVTAADVSRASAAATFERWGGKTGPEPETPADVDMWAAKDALQAEVAAEVFQAPAPLDPKNVKPGDTVTLESVLEAPFKVTGVVEKIDITLFDADGLAVAFNVMIWSRWFTVGINLRLTTHQPAPEPEPEYAPGFYTVHPYDSPETNWTGFVDSEGTFYGEEDGFFRQAFKGDYTVDSRLVVIDPADVDVEALSDVYDKAYDDSSHTSFSEGADIKAGLRAVLNALGIEVPR
jgi:hypothetical protein